MLHLHNILQEVINKLFVHADRQLFALHCGLAI